MTYSACDFSDDVTAAFVNAGLITKAAIDAETKGDDDGPRAAATLCLAALAKLTAPKPKPRAGYCHKCNDNQHKAGEALGLFNEAMGEIHDQATLLREIEAKLAAQPFAVQTAIGIDAIRAQLAKVGEREQGRAVLAAL